MVLQVMKRKDTINLKILKIPGKQTMLIPFTRSLEMMIWMGGLK
jgi:hypothetical protein